MSTLLALVPAPFRPALKWLARFGWVALILNEIRGLILAVPVLYALVQSGGGWMAAWVAFCSLAGIAASVIVPWWLARRLTR